jgi:hypothetical protein
MFRARQIYGVQTVQWACGSPIVWGKTYDSEGLSQVFEFLDSTFPALEAQPQFVVYDKACQLLAYIANLPVDWDAECAWWLMGTRFIVDAWHYINHHATDRLCQEWCNPAPLNGTQPDLIILTSDSSGRTHATQAFNTETAE